MIDTIKIAQLIKNLSHTDADFQRLGWQKKYHQTGHFCWSFKEKKGSRYPYLSIYQSPIGENFLWTSVSLPAFVHGSNACLLSQNEIRKALKSLSSYVSEKSEIDFDAAWAKVWRVDYAKDFLIGEELIRPSIQHLLKIQIPYFSVGGYNDTTCYFHSKGRSNKKPRTICIYGKYEDAVSKKFPEKDIALVEGVLRAEFKFQDKKAIDRLCKKHQLPENRADLVLTKKVSDLVLGSIEKIILGLNHQPDDKTKIEMLIAKFGKRHARPLVTFLKYRAVFGADFYKNKRLGYSESYYRACLRECKSVGIWSFKDRD